MIKLHTYINDLLCVYDCVIIPDFGGFVSNYHQAEYDELSHTLTPPSKRIFFNKELTYNDGLLATTISKNTNMTYADASEYLAEEVQNMWLDLEAGKTITIKNIGSFEYKNEKIIFNQETENNLLSTSFGLFGFRFPPLNYQNNSRTLHVKTHNNMKTAVQTTIKWAAIVIPLIAVVALYPYIKSGQYQTASFHFFTNEPEQLKPLEEVRLKNTTAMPDTGLADILNKTTEKKTALFYSEVKKEEPQTNTVKEIVDNKIYYIIGASYKTEKRALKQLKIFEKQGFNKVEIINSNELFRVSVSSYNSKDIALRELYAIRNKNKDDSFWLLAK